MNRLDVRNDFNNTSEALNGLRFTGQEYVDDSFALHTDLYQLNMAKTYLRTNLHNRRAVFEAYFRKAPFGGGYAVFAGLDRVIDFIANFRFSESDLSYLRNKLGYKEEFLDFLRTVRFDGNISSVVEGELIYPNEPLIRVDAKLAQAQLIETPLLNILNFHPLIATKAARIKCAVGDAELLEGPEFGARQDLMEFGMRRAHEFDSALWGARAAYIGGFTGTSNVRAGKVFGLPVKGTHAHAMVQVFGDEYEAFKAFSEDFENCIFLVDTYDTLKSGVPNAIRVAKEFGHKFNFLGIRLDSGDLVKLSIEARKMLDEAGFPNAKIYASNDLDEYEILRLKAAGARIDGWGIGTKLVTAFDQPALGAVYKLMALEDMYGNMVDSIKLSEDPSKATTPGLKEIYRIINAVNQRYEGDLIAMSNERPERKKKIILGAKTIEDFRAVKLHKDIFQGGKLVYRQPTIEEMRVYCMSNLRLLENAYRAIVDPQAYPVSLSQQCAENKRRNIERAMARMVG